MADGQIIFEITADGKQAIASVKDVTKAIDAESKKWDKSAQESTGGIEGAFSKMAKNISVALVAAKVGEVLISWGKDAIEAASNLAEVQNVVNTVFGDGAKVIDNWAREAGQKFGLTETMAKKFTSTLGAMMKSSGLAGDQIIGMSTDLAGLAADMASFYNLDFETAFEKIRAGISGQTMPLKQLGIDMSVANLQAFALAQGLEKTFDQMDQGEQTMLRYQYIMQATADAQGDFEKTSDGFANAQRRIQSSVDQIKTSVGTVMLPWIEKAIGGVASFLSQISSGMMPEKTVIDEFNEAEINTSEKLADIQYTYEQAEDLIKILKQIEAETVTLQNGTTLSLTNLFGDIAEIEKSGGDVNAYIQSLGLDVDYVVGKYNEWKEATRRLTSLIPSLTSQINSETGAIDGGTDALQKNLDEWKKNEENKVYWAEYYAKAEAVARAKGEQAGLQITAQAKKMAAERAKAAMEAQGAKLTVTVDENDSEGSASLSADQYEYNRLYNEYIRLLKEADKAQKVADASANDLADAEVLLADELKATELITGETLATMKKTSEVSDYLGKSTEDWIDSLKKAPEAAQAIKAVIDYYNGVRDSTKQAVNSTLKGFDQIIDEYTRMQGELARKGGEENKVISDYAEVWIKFGGSNNDVLKRMEKDWDKLTEREKEAHEALVKLRNEQNELNKSVDQYSPATLKANLESQIEFMRNYVENLEKLKEWGVSDEMIAQLSDGSKESAAYLEALASGTKEQAQEVSDLYAEVAEKKNSFVDTLTQNKLTVDETYSAMVETAKEAMEELDLGEQAAEAMGSTVMGIAEGIESHVGDVSSAVRDLMSALDPLTDLGFTWGFSDGSFLLELPNVPHFATGTDFVPSNNFPAFLDYGEAVLTAEENRIWQRFKNGQQPMSMDYDALGGVMRDNVKAGGNVYLDGRTVGHVISDAQGKSYRALQRSGWQG